MCCKISYIYLYMILILQNGTIDTHINRYINEEYEIVKSFETNILEINLDKYSIIIILGGHQSVIEIDKHIHLQQIVKLINKCLKLKKPILGICLGCQLLAYALGCKIKYTGKINVDYNVIIFGYDNIFRCHEDQIIPNNKINIIDVFEDIIYSFNYGNSYGIQCHPDIPPEYTNIYQNYVDFSDYINKNYSKIDNNNQKVITLLLDKMKQ